MATMKHGQYIAKVDYDGAIGSFFGEVVNTGDTITFYGRSVDELQASSPGPSRRTSSFARARAFSLAGPIRAEYRFGYRPIFTGGLPPTRLSTA